MITEKEKMIKRVKAEFVKKNKIAWKIYKKITRPAKKEYEKKISEIEAME